MHVREAVTCMIVNIHLTESQLRHIADLGLITIAWGPRGRDISCRGQLVKREIFAGLTLKHLVHVFVELFRRFKLSFARHLECISEPQAIYAEQSKDSKGVQNAQPDIFPPFRRTGVSSHVTFVYQVPAIVIFSISLVSEKILEGRAGKEMIFNLSQTPVYKVKKIITARSSVNNSLSLAGCCEVERVESETCHVQNTKFVLLLKALHADQSFPNGFPIDGEIYHSY